MKISEIFSNDHDEQNDIVKSDLRRELLSKSKFYIKLGSRSSSSLVKVLSLALKNLKNS